ncbi:hypothetical protein JW758_05070 [Candidatus Peregrinibacteria bacterium]|nr:hypothetical protein [Candidatus Peregrinibacteria bacterium]
MEYMEYFGSGAVALIVGFIAYKALRSFVKMLIVVAIALVLAYGAWQIYGDDIKKSASTAIERKVDETFDEAKEEAKKKFGIEDTDKPQKKKRVKKSRKGKGK